MKKLLCVLPVFALVFGAAGKPKGEASDIVTGVSYGMPQRRVQFSPDAQAVKVSLDVKGADITTGATYYWLSNVETPKKSVAAKVERAEFTGTEIVTGATYYWLPDVKKTSVYKTAKGDSFIKVGELGGEIVISDPMPTVQAAEKAKLTRKMKKGEKLGIRPQKK